MTIRKTFYDTSTGLNKGCSSENSNERKMNEEALASTEVSRSQAVMVYPAGSEGK